MKQRYPEFAASVGFFFLKPEEVAVKKLDPDYEEHRTGDTEYTDGPEGHCVF